jgi:hypothetical protein
VVVADTICHATQGGLLLLAPFFPRIRKRVWLWILCFIGAGFGSLPDLIGAYGNTVLHDHWMLYDQAHFGRLASILQYVPMYELHLLVDSFTHGQGKRWWIWDERLWVEILLWVVNGVVIWWMVTSWQKRQQISG